MGIPKRHYTKADLHTDASAQTQLCCPMTDRLPSIRDAPGKASMEGLLGLSVLFGLLLIAARFWHTGEPFFGFLVWNLFLATIPLGVSRLLKRREAHLGAWPLLALVGVWLLFFPNAPYILTDLFHLGPRHRIPLWYDLVVFLTFAWNGLVLGFLSLYQVQGVLRRRFGPAFGWLCALAALFLGSFGIYIGRYLRWNSWDVLASPFALWNDLLPRLLDPLSHPGTWGMTVVFTVFLLLCYLMLISFARSDDG